MRSIGRIRESVRILTLSLVTLTQLSQSLAHGRILTARKGRNLFVVRRDLRSDLVELRSVPQL